MKNFIYVFLIFSITSCNNEKIGYLDEVRLMDNYQGFVDVNSKYEKKMEAFVKKRDSISTAIQIEFQTFQTETKNLSAQKTENEYALFQQRGQFLGQQLKKEEEELELMKNREITLIRDKIKKKVESFAITNNYSYILKKGVNGDWIQYGIQDNELTDLFIQILNDEYDNNN